MNSSALDMAGRVQGGQSLPMITSTWPGLVSNRLAHSPGTLEKPPSLRPI